MCAVLQKGPSGADCLPLSLNQIHFHPSSEQRLVSGSTDGLVNVFDISETTEEDALVSTYNTEATVVRERRHAAVSQNFWMRK